MNLPQWKRTICMDLKRAVRMLPAFFLYTLLFLIISAAIIRNGDRLFFDKSKYDQVSVGVYMPEDKSHSTLNINLIKDMKSFNDTVDLTEYNSEDQVLQALKNGEIVAAVIVPEKFVDSVLTGTNYPVRIVFRNNDTMEEHIINDILLNYADMLGTGQASMYTILAVNDLNNVEYDNGRALARSLDASNLSYVLTKETLFSTRNFDELSSLSLQQQIIGSFTLLMLFFLCFLLTGYYQGRKSAYMIRQRGNGLGTFGVRSSEWIGTVLLLYACFLLIFLGLLIMGFPPKWTSLITMIPILMISGFLLQTLSYSVRSPIYANLIILIVIILLMYLSGGLVPMDFLPKFLQKISDWNPFYWLIRATQHVLY